MAEILDNFPLLLALDVGGTNCRAELVAWQDGALSEPIVSAALRTPVRDGDGTVRTITELCHELLGRLTDQQRKLVAGVGLGVPGVLDPDTGVVRLASNLGWRNRHVAQEIQAAVGLPVFLTHDVTAAGTAEQMLGAGRGEADVMAVFVGTGIAATVTSGGVMLRGGLLPGGERQQAGEIGHLPVAIDGPLCGCGQRGCLELYCSARAIGRLYSEALGIDPMGAQRKSSRDCVDALDRDIVAREVWATATRYLAHGLLVAETVVGPSRIVLGGGLSAAGDVLTESVRGWLKQTSRVVAVPEIVLAQLGQRAGIMGVALNAAERLSL